MQTALKNSHKLKPAGIYHVSNDWLNSLYKEDYILGSLLSDTIKKPEESHPWLSERITHTYCLEIMIQLTKGLQAHKTPQCNLKITNINYHREDVCIHEY